MKFEKREDRKIKYQALHWLRIKQRCCFIATEVGAHSADVLGVSEKKMIEVEVKISKADLVNDFKKHKHSVYVEDSYGSWQQQWIPTHFYYAVPSALVEEAKRLIESKMRHNYGVIDTDTFEVVKRAKWLHKREPSAHIKFVVALRMGSELIRFHEAWL